MSTVRTDRLPARTRMAIILGSATASWGLVIAAGTVIAHAI